MRRAGRENSDTGNGAGEQGRNYSLPPDSIHSIVNLQQGDHLCCIYETEEEHQAVGNRRCCRAGKEQLMK
ncbi:MAG: hypothetical protein ACP5FL_01095 [Thermoplasmatota archaeon]